MQVTSHVARNDGETNASKRRRSAIDARTTRHGGYQTSHSRRTMIERIFRWCKQHGTIRQSKHSVAVRVAADFLLNLFAHNLIRIPKLVIA